MSFQLQDLAAWLSSYALHSTILLGLAWAVVRFRRIGPGATEVIWKVALVGGIVTATAQGMLGHQPAGSLSFDARVATVVGVGGSSDDAARGVTGADGARTADTDGVRAANEDAAGSTVAGLRSSAAAGAAGSAVLDAGVPTGSNGASAVSMPSLPTLVVIGWLVVAALLVAGYAARRLVLVGRLGDRRPLRNRELSEMLAALRTETGVNKRMPVRLTTSRSISSPVALAGEICLPAAVVDELEPEQQRAMLAHELAHLVRRDPQWLAAACLLERAFFFQPLNRLARRGVQSSAEYLADEWAARRAGGVPLARALVKVAEWMQASPLGVPVAGFAEERSQLTVRVSRLLDRAAWSKQGSRWGVGVLAAAMLVVTTAFAPGVSRALVGEGENSPGQVGNAPGVDKTPSGSAGPEAVDPEAIDPETFGSEPTSRSFEPPSRADVPVIQTVRPQRQDTSIVAAIIGRLGDENAEVRRAAADALGRLQHASAIQPLIRSLEDQDPEVREAALNALGNFERGVPAAPIRGLLASPDANVRSQAVQMLGDMEDAGSISAITALLADANADVRRQALDALDDIEAPIDEAAIGRALEDRTEDVRETAAELAGERRMTTLVPALIRMLEDPFTDVRQSAAEALTEMRTDESHRALRMAITHSDAKVRLIAVEYLGEGDDR